MCVELDVVSVVIYYINTWRSLSSSTVHIFVLRSSYYGILRRPKIYKLWSTLLI